MSEHNTLDGSRTLTRPGPLVAAFHFVLSRFEFLSGHRVLDEETLTASILGGLSVALPLFVERYGSGDLNTTRQCCWGPYKKSGRVDDPESEAATGADFCLVLWDGPDTAKLAIFQAKKGITKKDSATHGNSVARYWLNVHRKSRKEDRLPQLVTLIETGHRIMSRKAASKPGAKLQAPGNAVPSRGSQDARQLGWIHYLAYLEGSPVCVPLSKIDTQVISAEYKSVTGAKWSEIPAETTTLFELLRRGLEQGEVEGWLPLDSHSIADVLPILIPLMPVYVGDERGGHSLDLVDSVSAIRALCASASRPEQIKALAEMTVGANKARSIPRLG